MFSYHSLIQSIRNINGKYFHALSHISGATAVTIILSFGTNILWTRLFDPEIFGTFRLILSFVAVISAFSFMGVSTAMMISVTDKSDGDVQQLIRTKFYFNLALALLLFLGLSIYAGTTDIKYLNWQIILICTILYPIYNLSDVWASWLNAKRNFLRLSISRIIRASLAFFTIFLSGYFLPESLFFVVCAFFLLIGLQNLYELKNIFSQLKNDRKNPETLRFTKHLSIAIVFSSLTNADILLLGYYFTANEIAIYTIILVFPELIKSIWSILNQVLSPFAFSERKLIKFWQKFRNIFYLLVVGWIFLGILGFLLIPFAVELFFSENYEMSGIYGKTVWLFYCLGAPFAFFANSVLASQHKVFAYIQQAGHPILAVIMFAIFIPHGIQGLVIARIILSIAISIFHVLSFCWLAHKEAKA